LHHALRKALVADALLQQSGTAEAAKVLVALLCDAGKLWEATSSMTCRAYAQLCV
jgi:hypothetical protein